MNPNRHSIEGDFAIPCTLRALVSSAADAIAGIPSGFADSVAGPLKEIATGAKLDIDSIDAQRGIHGNPIRLEFIDIIFTFGNPPTLQSGTSIVSCPSGIFDLGGETMAYGPNDETRIEFAGHRSSIALENLLYSRFTSMDNKKAGRHIN